MGAKGNIFTVGGRRWSFLTTGTYGMGPEAVTRESIALVSATTTNATSLEAVANHERQLIDRRAAAKAEAEEIVANARRDADAIAQTGQRNLEQKTAEMRAAAEAEQNAAREAILSGVEGRINEVRSGAEGRMGGVVDEIVQLLLPKSGGSA